MALIKQAASTLEVRDAIVLNLGDLRLEAERLRTEALAERDRILAEARAERDRIMAGASEVGYDAGYAEGLEQGRAKGEVEGESRAYEESLEAVQRYEASLVEAVESISHHREVMLREAKFDVLLFACTFAERVTKRAIELDPEIVETQLLEAASLVLDASTLVISMHPDDQEICERVTPALHRQKLSESVIRFMADPSLERGSIVLSTQKGKIDASIRMQIERIVTSLVGSDRLDDRLSDTEGSQP